MFGNTCNYIYTFTVVCLNFLEPGFGSRSQRVLVDLPFTKPYASSSFIYKPPEVLCRYKLPRHPPS